MTMNDLERRNDCHIFAVGEIIVCSALRVTDMNVICVAVIV